jgi:putative tricarboxylic transport membrane protein
MVIKNGKDLWAGIMFTGTGIFFMIASRAFPMGTAVRMGPAYFPMVLGGLLVALGLVILVRAFVSKVPHSINVFPFRLPMAIAGGVLIAIAWASAKWFASLGSIGVLAHWGLSAAALFLLIGAFGTRALYIILAGTTAFGYLLKPLGLVLATGVLIFVSAWGGHEFKLREVIYLFIALAIFAVAVFIYGLGLPMNIWPELG